VYRFLATPRWLGLAALTLVLVAGMVTAGLWQLHRYQERSARNARVDASATAAPVPARAALPPAAPGGGSAPPAAAAWTRITASGVYDPAHEVLARGRTVGGRVGYEVLTPLRLPDGSALLVDRGWVPPGTRGARSRPDVPPAPAGPVTVVGRVHLPESGAGPVERLDGTRQVRRIGVAAVARELPYPVYGAYLLLDTQTPPADPRLVAVPVERESALQNAGYVVQWWLFAALALVGFGWLARREAHPPPARPAGGTSAAGADRAGPATDPPARPG